MSRGPSPALNAWLDQAAREPLLTHREELELGRLIQRWRRHPDPCPRSVQRAGLRARERMIKANIKLVVRWSHRYAHLRGVDHDDLISAGFIGLARAVDGFDPSRGYKFSTYSFAWVRQSFQRYALQKTYAMTLPIQHKELLERIPSARAVLRRELGREPGIAEVAGYLNSTPERVAELLQCCYSDPLSLDAPAPGAEAEDGTLGELVPAPESPDGSSAAAALAAMEAADPDTTAALELLADGHRITQVSEAFGVSLHRLRHLTQAARVELAKLPEVQEALVA